MKTFSVTGLVLTTLLALALSTVWAGAAPARPEARGGVLLAETLSGDGYELNGELVAPSSAPPQSVEIWRLGYAHEGAVSGGDAVGRAVGEAAAFRSSQAADLYYAYPASATATHVLAARFCLLDRTGGAYGGAAALSLEVVGYDGTVHHTVSRQAVDLASAATGAWTLVQLSLQAADREIAPGELLTFHLRFSGGPGGDLDVRPVFEAEVGQGSVDYSTILYLPILLRQSPAE
jgi:hypothetical protein